MTAIDLLLEEHRALEAMLDALEAATRRVRDGQDVPAGAIEEMFVFCKRFTDGCHHVNEEEILFPALAAHGLTPDMTPMAALAAQHESGRAFLGDLQNAYERLAGGDESVRRDIYILAREYAGMLREHIAIEDHYFRSPAAEALTPEEDEKLRTAILQCARAGGPLERRKFLDLATRHRNAVDAW